MNTPNQPVSLPERLIHRLRRPIWKTTVSSILLAQFALWSVQVNGANLSWDAVVTGSAGGGTGTWDDLTTNNWFNGANVQWNNANFDTAVFGGAAGTVTLGMPITAGGLTFNTNGYLLTGSTLTLTPPSGVNSPLVAVNGLGARATLSSFLSGTSGFTKSGNGTLKLTANNAGLSGDIAIKAGNVVISNTNQLGAGTTAIGVVGIAGTGNPGFTGGSLVLDGSAGGVNLTREVSVSGRGPGAANASGGLVSVGYNTISGGLVLGSGASEGRALATYGITTIGAGGLYLGTGAANILNGNGNWIVSGQVAGSEVSNDRFIKGGILVDTTLWLQNANNKFTESLRIDSGSVRVATNSALGLNFSTQALDLNGGRLEVRTDAPADFLTRNVFVRDGTTSTVFVDHGVGTYTGATAQNQTVTFGSLRATGTNSNTVLAGRNGFSASFTGAGGNITGGGANSPVITNNSSGTFTLNATTLWGQTDTTARTLTITGGGETNFNGRITASGAIHTVTKTGSGSLTLSQAQGGTASTFTGNFNANDGTTEIRTIDVLNPTSTGAGRVVFGNGALSFLGNAGTGAGETWTNKILDLGVANSYLLANQAGSAPTALVVPNNWAASSNATGKTLNLGGTSTQFNSIQGLITNGKGITNVIKYGTGTWEISAPTSYGTSGTVSVAATGATATGLITLASGSTGALVVGQPISGTGFAAGTVITQINSGTTFTVSQNRTASSAADPAAPIGVASGAVAALTTTAASTGTTALPIITVANTANLVPGQQVTHASLPANQNWYIRDVTSGTTITLVSGIGSTMTVGAIASGQVVTPALSPNFGGNLAVSNGTLRLNAASAGSNIVSNTSNLIFANDAVTNLGSAGGTLDYVGFSAGSSTEVLGRLNPAAGHGIVKITNGTGADTLTFLDLSRAAGATLDLQPGSIGTIGFTTTPTLTSGVLPGYATFNGVDFVTLSGSNAAQYTSATPWTGALSPTSSVNYSVAGVANSTGGAVNSLKLTGGAALTLGAVLPITTNPGGLLFDNTLGAAIIDGAFQLGTTAQELVVTTNGSSPATTPVQGAALVTGNALSIGSGASNTVISSGAGLLTKTGTGTVILFGGNAYTGNTTINQGALQLSGSAARLGTITTVTNITTIRQAGILDINAAGASAALYTGGTTYPVTTIGSLSGSGMVTNSGGGTSTQSTLNIGLLGTTTSSATFSGALQDGAGLLNVTKNGTGTQAIVGAKTYTGITTINAGTLAVTRLADGDSSLGNSSNAASNLIFGGGTLLYTGANTSGAGIYQITQTPSATSSRLFSLAGNATIQSSGTYGNETGAAGTGQNNASLIFSNTGDVVFLTGTAKTLTLGGTSIGDNVFTPRILNNTVDASATALTKADAGLWILNPTTSNTHTGATTITGGALQVAAEGAAVEGLPSASHLVLNGGVLQSSGNFTRTATATPGTNTMQWTGNGGFAASTSKLTVNLGGGAINLGTAPYAGSTLILSSTTALADVEIQNNIELGTAARTIQVDNNGNTGLDFATVSGIINGGVGGALTKTGSAPLILGNANTYVGNTTVSDGQLFVTSIGTGVSSSIGASGTFISNQGDADFNPLLYVGVGESANRNLTLQATPNFTANRLVRIDSSGSGALVWNTGTFAHTTRGDTAVRALTLELRGNNTDANQMNLVLTNSTNATFANVLHVTKTDGGVWILNPASPNTFTGNINAASGMLGLTNNGIGSATAIALNNGGIFAYGGPLITSTPVVGNNSTAVFGGANAITINANVSKTAGNNQWTISNNLEGGALLTVNGNFINLEAAATAATQTISIRGYGSTLWNGAITENVAAGGKTAWNIALSPDASFTTTGAANAYSGTTTLTDGILILDKTATPLGSGTFAFNGGTLRVGPSIANLTGANAITNPIAINASPPKVDGTKSIEFSGAVTMGASRNLQNELTGGASLTLSGTVTNTVASTLTIYGAGNTLIPGNVTTGTGAQGLQLSGTGTLSLTGTNLATGALSATRSTITLSGAAGGSWNAGTAAVNPTGTLTLDNSGGNNAAGRLFDTGAFAGNGGTLNIITDGAASTETTGALTLTNVQTNITMSGAGTNTLTFASATFANTGSSLDLSTIATLGGANKVLITAALPANALINSIMPRTFINGGADFATYNAVNGVQAFAAYNVSNNLNTALITDTMDLTASAATTANRQVNAIKINGTGLVISGAAANRLTLGTAVANASAAAIINTGGNNSLDINEVAFGANTGYIQVAPGTTLTLNGDLSGNTAFAKVLSGALTFGAGARSFVSSTQNLLDGTTNLNGGPDTLLPNTGQLTLGVSATLNLNGGGQYIGLLASPGALPGGGGTINGGGALVTNGGGTFGGVISSGTSLGRVGGGTLTLESAQTYTGTTLLMGGTTTLENDATLLDGTTSEINLNNATLFLGNNNSFQTQNNNRIGDAIPLNLRGGTISATGRLSTAASETFGVVNALQGANTITATVGGGTFSSQALTFASLNRATGAGVVVNFTGSSLGQEGNSARIFFTTPLTSVAGGALGGWAIANTTDFAAYNTGLGVGIVGAGGFAGYDSAFGTGNITELTAALNSNATTTTLPGNTTTGLLKFAGNTFNNLAFTASGDVLNIEHGGVLRSNNNFGTSIGTAAIRGVLTAGGTDPTARELFVFNNGAANPTFGSGTNGATTTLGSPVVTGGSAFSTVGLQPGMTVTNANFPAGTTVLSVQSSGQVTLSNNATASNTTNQTLTAGSIDLGAIAALSNVVTMASTVGISPGMTISNVNLPANTFVLSVDSPTQVTLSQNSINVAPVTLQTMVVGMSNMVINSVIANNATAPAAVTLVKSGAGVLTLTAPNTYTGGTIVNSPLNLAAPGTAGIASHATIPAATNPADGLVINNGTVTMLTNSGQIAATNEVTLRGGSVLTLAGNNSLAGLAFDNNGGTATPTVTSLANSNAPLGLLTLTNATPITVTSSNPASVATIAGNINLGTGAKTINTPTIQVGGVTVTNLVPTLAITGNILSPGVTLNKTGLGLLQLSGQSTFTGGVNLTAGGIVIGASSTPAQGGAGITSGPLGSGTLTASVNTILVSNSTAAIGNDIVFNGTPTFDSINNTVWTMTLNGTLSGAGMASPVPTIEIANPGLTVALLGNIPNIGTITSFNKTGLGTLVFNSTGYTGNYDAGALGNGLAVQLLHDGTGLNVGNSTLENIVLPGTITFDAIGTGTVTVGRAGGSLPFNLAANKVINPGAINTVASNGLIVANNAGYGLEVSEALALAGTPTFTVNTATASNVTQGLYLTGDVSGTGFIKAGAGALVLANTVPANNTYVGNTDIRQGVVSVNADAQLGVGNVLLNPTTGTSTLRATGTFATSRVIDLAVATNLRAIEVTGGNTLILNSAFGLTAAAAGLIKADSGTLVLAADNSLWNGPLTISGGIVSTNVALNLGSGTGVINVNAPGAALQLNGGITIPNPITIDSLVDGRNVTGINTQGAIQAVTGANIISNTVTVNATTGTDNQSRGFGFAADLGASLTFNGAINFNHANTATNRNTIIYLGGAGDLTLNNVLNNTNATPGANSFVFKNGNGTMTLTAANAIQDSEVRTYRGTILVNGAGTFGTGASQIQAWQNGTIEINNSGTNTLNRFSNRVVQIGGGTLNFVPNAAGTTHTSTGALQISQGANTINLAAGGDQTVTFASLTQNAGATLNLTGTFGTAINKLTFTTALANVPAGAGGLLARVTTNGNEFATYTGATNGVGTFTAYAPATNILSAGATQTFRATSTTANSLTGSQTVNAINLNSGPLIGNSPNLGGLGGLNPPITLTLTSGAILANGTGAGASSTLSVPIVALGGVEGIIHVASGQTLNVTSGFSGTAGVTKSLPGTLNLNQQQYVSGNTIVNGGTLNLQSGATNTLLFNNGLGVNTGATVDLKNGVQFIGSLFSANGGGNTDLGGGTVTNSGSQATLVTNSNSNFNGQITGTIYLNKTGTNSLNLQSANTYSGDTLITGGTLTVQDDGTILNTPAIGINYGSLTISNNSLRANSNRVSDTAPITMKGGNITFNGRAQTNSTETLGAVSLVEGHNTIFPGRADPGINSGDLTLASLSRSVGSTATLRFNNLTSVGIIGSQARVFVTANPTLTNNIIGPWAIVDREYATYDATYGISALGQVGVAGYAGSGLNTSPLATDNVRFATAGGTTILAGNTVVNTLNISQGTASAILDLGGNTLRLQGGGLLIAQNSDNTSVTINNGTITSGVLGSPSDFYLIHAPFDSDGRPATINAVIADNTPVTGTVRLIAGGADARPVASALILNGANTYTGGTVLNQSTIVLGATGALGTGGITVNGATFVQTAGGVIPSQNLTMGGSSVVTLAGANSLSGITFANMGGAAPTLNPTGTLTLTGGIAVTTMNAGNIATIANGTLDLNASGAYSINTGATLINGVNAAPWQSSLTINSVIQNGGIAKTGDGLLQLGGQSTFTGGINVTGGGLIIGASSTPNGLLDPVTTGPLGTGAVTMAANTTLVSTAANIVSNNFTFLGDTVFNGTNSLTLNGITTLPAIWNATVTAPQMVVTIGDASPSGALDVINKSGLGFLSVGNYAGTLIVTGGLFLNADGNTLGTPESLNLGGNVVLTGDTAITVNRSGGAPNARNKTIQKVDLTNPGSIVSVSNQNGYGLEFTGTTTMNGLSHFAVGVATASNVVQGLTLTGPVTDLGANLGIIKSGPGTLVLSDAANAFGGVGSTVDILNGVVSVPNDGALGNLFNTVTLNVDASTGVGFRSTGTFTSARTFNLNQANNAMEVTAGNVLTLTTPFVLSAATNTLTKNDNGVLALNANNTGWTGAITINSGAIRLMQANAIGTGVVTINNAVGSALQLDGGVNYANPITLALTGQTGINSGGVLQSVSGSNTFSGLITQGSGVGTTIGADAGATLNITGGISTINSTTFNVGAGGDIFITTVAYGNGLAGGPTLAKIGNGTLTLSVNSATATTPALNISAGTVVLNSGGVLGGATTTAGVLIDVGGTLTLNNTTAAGGSVNDRLGGSTRPINFRGGNFNLIGTDAGGITTETLDAPTFSAGFSTITVTASTPADQTALVFDATSNIAANPQNALTAAGGVPSGTSVLFRGTNLGTAAGPGVATIQNTGPNPTAPTRLGFNFNGATTGATGSPTKGILPWAILETTDSGTGTTARFATGDAAANAVGTNAILRQLSNSEMSVANAAFATNVNELVTASRTVTANVTPNSVTMETAGELVISPFVTLALASGGYLLKSTSGAGITGGILSQINTASPFNFWAVENTTITSLLNGGNGTANGNIGFVKAGAGILTLSTPQFAGLSLNSMSGQTVINQGTLKLNGGTNTIQANNFLQINQGGTLDLNGNSQQVLALFSAGSVDGAGGIITSSTGTGSLVVNHDNAGRSWAGSIQGAVNFTRSGQNTTTFYSPQTYSGTTLINGGTTTLRDNATLSGTGTLDINYATLLAENGGTIALTNRINDSKAITLRGGTLTIQGRASTASTEALGTVSVAQGFAVINPLVGGTGLNSVDVSLVSLSRPAGSSATLIVQGTNLGTIGSNSRVTVGTLNGVATTPIVYSRNGSGLTENIVGGWAENGNDFLTYIPGLGLAALNQVGAPQYDLNNTFVGALSTDNIRLTATTNVTLGGATANAVSMSGSNIALNFLGASDRLNITSGGLIGPNNNQNIGTVALPGVLTAGGSTPTPNSDLYVFNRTNTLTINSKISDNTSGGGSAVRAVFTASGGAITLTNAANDYSGGTVLNGGTLNLTNIAATPVIPAGGIEINNGTVTMNNFAGQIAASNVVTLNGTSTISFFGDNTIEGLILNNIGGGAGNLTVNSFTTGTAFGAGSTGVLSIGNAGIVATSSNVASAGIIIGRADFGATAKTINVAPINANGVDISPLQAAFVLQGVVGTTGGITKTGNGVLQFSAQAHYTGPTTVNAGGIRAGVTNGGSRFSALTLNGVATTFNIFGANTTWGSLAGSGTVFNSSGAATFTVGFNNDTTTTFSGQLSRFNDAVVNAVGLQKVGTGELVMTGVQNFATGTTGTITVNGGTLRYLDSGEAFNGTTGVGGSGGGRFTVNNGGTLALDNTGTANVNSRLGLDVIGTLDIQGGRLTLNGTSTAATSTTETITTFNVTNGGGRIELSPNAANPLTLAIATLNTANGNGSLVIGGIIGAASADGVARVTITTPNLIGGQGTGANGTSTMPVRHDILADASVSGLGTGFLVRDSVTNNYRALGTDSTGAAAPGELAAAISLPLVAGADDQNVGLSSAQTIGVNSLANTLTISGTASVGSSLGATFGNYGPAGGLLTLSLSQAAASLTLAGATGTISVGSFGSTTVGTTPYVHVITGGTLNINSAFAVNGTAGMLKADGGILNLNNSAYYTGATTVNGGTLNLNSGSANTIAVVPTAGGATVSQLSLNGTNAVVDLKGRNQAFGVLTSINPLPGLGGTIQNTGALATLSLNGTGAFSGVITGDIALTRAGNNTTTLTNVNAYTGATIVRGGVLELRDSGAISSTAGLTLNYGSLNWNNFGLNAAGDPNPTRVAANNPVTLQGGTIRIDGAGSTDTVLTLNSVTVTGGSNVINTQPFINEGSTVKLTIGNLARNVSNHSGVVFNGFTTNNSGNGSSTLGGQGLTTNSNVFVTQVNGATGPLHQVVAGAVTLAGNATVTVPSTLGLVVGQPITGTGLPAGKTIASILSATQFTLNNGTGVTAQTSTTLTSTNLTDNLIGGWAVADGSTFATYSNIFGVSTMGNTFGSFAAPTFDGTDVSAATTATQNINDGTAARTLATGLKSANSWRFGPAATQVITFATGATTALDVGIITNAAFSTTLLATDATNTLTGTGTDLYFYINQNTTVVQPQIIGTAALVSNGPATLSLRPQFASNTYSGGTFINGGTTTLIANPGFIAIPGDLTITGSANSGTNTTVTMTTNAGQMATTANVLINGGGTLNMTGSNTLNSVTFNNQGSGQNPTVATSTLLILDSATPVTASNDSLATVPVISGTALQFGNLAGNPVITVNNGLAETELTISAPITQHANMLSLSKNGLGALALSGASTFTTGFALNQGSLILGANSTPSTVGATVTSGPLGTAALAIADGTTLISDGTLRTIANAVTVNGDFTIGGPVAGNGVILNGTMDLGAVGRTITLSSPAVTATIGGAITSAATGTALTKTGAGTLILSSATNNFGGAGVAVTGGILKSGIGNAIPVLSKVAISAGAGYDLNNFDSAVEGITGAGFITQSGATTKVLTISSTVSDSTFSGVLTDNNLGAAASILSLSKTGSFTQTLTNVANTYGGITSIGAGVLEVTKLAAGSAASSIGDSSAAATNLVFTGTGGTLRYIGAGDTTDRNFTVGTAGGTIESSGTGALIWSGAATMNPTGAPRTFTLGGSNTADNTFSSALANSAGPDVTNFVKAGAGKWVLTGINTYTGTTDVNGGVLQVGTAAITTATSGTGATTVASTATLAGTGTVGGVTTVQSGGFMAPGDNSGATNNLLTMTAASATALTIDNGGQLQLSISAATLTSSLFETYLNSGGTNAAAYLTTNPTEVAVWNVAPGTITDHDRLNLTGAGSNLSIGTRSGAYGTGTVLVSGVIASPSIGMVFNLIDWVQALGFGGTFTNGGGLGFAAGGTSAGDLDLPVLGGVGFGWDTSAFQSYGIIVVVPEPGRALLMLLGLMALFFRRRRQD